MEETLSLFGDEEDDEPAFKRSLKERLDRLREQSIFIGTSSWKYPGWLGQIYTANRYRARGRFSKVRFERECLREYAETFPVVCGDFAFYQFPARDFWAKLFDSAPAQLQFAFKVPEDITAFRFPDHTRYGARAGHENPGFLNRDLFASEFLELLSPYLPRVPLLIFEFGAASGRAPPAFAEALSNFFSGLPSSVRYAVEIRNAELLDPVYFEVLREQRIAHVLNSWTRMPPLAEQLSHPGIFTTDFSVTRALLKPGRKYEEAVRQFEPYSETREVNGEVRKALLELLLRAKRRAEPTYLFINNRLEGNAPNTIYALTEED